MERLKMVVIHVIRGLLRLTYVLPIKKNRVYLSADRGEGIRCNPYYIYQYLRDHYPGECEFIWEAPENGTFEEARLVKKGSLKSMVLMMTSAVLISNDGFGSFLPKRKGQVFINTWHGGGAYKRSGTDFLENQKSVEMKINRICGEQTDVFLSSSVMFSDVMAPAKLVARDSFLECGMPRNDFLINGTEKDIRGKVYRTLGIPEGKKMFLYAPTFRGNEQGASFENELDMNQCLQALASRFGGEWVIVVRMHHFVKEKKEYDAIDASSYPDMQELLYAADAFMTDYSSCMWDYSLTGKPGFLYMPDLDSYTSERNFYTPVSTWPFAYAKTNAELATIIAGYDVETAAEQIRKHHELLGCRDVGTACETVSNRIMGILQGKEKVN